MSRVAVVTGAGTGIGRGIALALVRRGMGVALVGRRREPLETVAEEMSGLRPEATTAVIPADLAHASERQRLVEEVHQKLGTVSVLINNAAVLAHGELAMLSSDEIERAVAVNLIAPIDLTRLLEDELAENGGAVAFVASNARFIPLPSAAILSATKAAMANLADALRYELEPRGIHVMAAYPPDTDTPMLASLREGRAWQGIRLASAEAVGERMIAALEQRRREVRWGIRERLLVALYLTMPRLIQAVLRRQRGQFARIPDDGITRKT